MKFIPLAEETGLIVPSANGSCGRPVSIDAWRPQNDLRGEFISPAQFQSCHLHPNGCPDRSPESGLRPGRLELEITEAVLLEDTKAALNAACISLRQWASAWSMDDLEPAIPRSAICGAFPSTRSRSISSFIDDLIAGGESLAIVRAVTGSRQDPRHARPRRRRRDGRAARPLLRKEACTQVQGHLFSAPRPAAELEGLLRPTSLQRAAGLHLFKPPRNSGQLPHRQPVREHRGLAAPPPWRQARRC